MTTVRSVLGKSSVSGLVILLFAITACGLAWRGDIDGPTFVGLLALPLAFLFRNWGDGVKRAGRYVLLFAIAPAMVAFAAISGWALFTTLDDLALHDIGWRVAGIGIYVMFGCFAALGVFALDGVGRS